MSTAIPPYTKGIDVNAHILSTLDKLDEAHLAKKPLYFAKGFPFYTCIDSPNDLWTKELPDGKAYLVKMDYDFDKNEIVETLIREIN